MNGTPPASVAYARLEGFAAAVGEEGFETGLIAAGPDAAFDTLVVAVGEEETGLYRLELSFVPGMEQELEGVSILQCFVAVASEVPAEHAAELARLTTILNARLPLVAFGHLERERMAIFRHLLLLPPDDAAGRGLVVQAVWLVSYLLAQLGAGVARVAAGQASADEVLRASRFAAVFT
jgi:hypothetical protein